jgi:hypothetical protein
MAAGTIPEPSIPPLSTVLTPSSFLPPQASEQTSSFGAVNSSLPPRRDFALLSWGGQLLAWGGKSRDASDGYAREVWATSDCTRWTRMDISNVDPWWSTPIAGVAVAASLGRSNTNDVVLLSGGHTSSSVDTGSPAVAINPNTYIAIS